jgi:hypothetical protein
MDITYDVSNTEAAIVTVSFSVSNGASAVSAPSVTGDIGLDVETGVGKTIVWDMAADWNGDAADLTYAVMAVFVLPADGGDPAAISWEVVNARWVKNTYANGDITMSDRDTGLMWLYNANPCGSKQWQDAMNYCDNLTYAGRSDWRLPNKGTLSAQYSQRNYFSNVQTASTPYWSSTTATATTAWFVSMYIFNTATYNFINYCYVWPVRGGQ